MTPSTSALRPQFQPTFIWRQQFTIDQFKKLDSIQRARKCLNQETLETSKWLCCQLREATDFQSSTERFRSIIGGKEVSIELEVRPMLAEYAAVVYQQAVKDLMAYYPHCTRHEIVDGPMIGERRIVFPDFLNEAATTWLRSRFWEIAEHGNILLKECISSSPHDGGLCMILVLDREKIDDAVSKNAAAVIANTGTFPVSDEPKRIEVKAMYEMLAEVSLPELVPLNWDDVKPPCGPHEKDLFGAISTLELEKMRNALLNEANPNALEEQYPHNSALAALVSAVEFFDEKFPGESKPEKIQLVIKGIHMLVEAGAAVNWAPFEENTPLAQACIQGDPEIIEALIELGADPSIRCYSDEYPSEWGTAWEFADYLCNPHASNDDFRAWNALMKHFKEPYGNVRMERNQSPELPS